MDKEQFPILRNYSIIPPDFHVFEINLAHERCQFLQKMGCCDLIEVDSPAGWEIQRTGRGEPLHLDMFYIMSGKIEIRIPHESITLLPGKSVIIPSWIPRILTISEPCYHIYIRFNQPELFPHIRSLTVKDSVNGQAVKFYLQQLLINHSTLSNEIAYRSALLECLGILFRRDLEQTQCSISHRGEEFMDYLQHAAGKDLTVTAAAARFGMSLSGLRIFCKQQFGKSPFQLIQKVKMQRAQALLSYGGCSMEKVAEELGYADRFAFSKAFTRLNHFSPGKYRNRKS